MGGSRTYIAWTALHSALNTWAVAYLIQTPIFSNIIMLNKALRIPAAAQPPFIDVIMLKNELRLEQRLSAC